MKPKKNPNVDLKKRVGLFFSIGLAIATFASLYAINYKSVEEGKKKIGTVIDYYLVHETPKKTTYETQKKP